jgi:uncharacterized protein
VRAAVVGLISAALAASILAGCTAQSPPPAPGPGTASVAPGPCLSQLTDALFLTCLRTEVDEVWGRALRDTGRSYPSMPLTVADRPRPPGREGNFDEPDRAYFSQRSGTHFPTEYLDAVQAAHGTDAHLVLTFTMAHEVGHHVQFLLHPREDALVNDIESQADCYAGVWARRAADAGRLDVAVFRTAAAAELRRLSSSYAGEVETHGDAGQRVASVDTGLGSGDPAACDRGRLTWRSDPAAR